MFDAPEAARQIFAEQFSRPHVEMLVEALQPTIAFGPIAGRQVVIGGSRFGGVPDLPPGLDWPKPSAPADPAAVAKRGNSAAGAELVAHYRLELPYLFVAQVDLAEAKALGRAAAELPGNGRLLFFYDLAAGPYDNGTSVARVIWDQSERETLEARALPEALAEASSKSRAERAAFDEDKARLARAGTNYEAPSRPMRLKADLRLPHKETLEVADRPELKGLFGGQGAGEEFSDRYSKFFERYDSYYDAANGGRRNQLLGAPLPEQSDPRFDAVVTADFGVQFLAPEEWRRRNAEIEVKARDWRLLLQVDVADLMQDDLSEGTVYFLIRGADLAARRFDAVVAIYQQT